LDCGRKPEHPEETHTDTRRMCKLQSPRLDLNPGPWRCEAAVLTTDSETDRDRHRERESETYIKNETETNTRTSEINAETGKEGERHRET